MERAPDEREEPGEPHAHPKIDFTAALGEAGHEVEQLGFEGVPDIGPVIEDHTAPDEEVALEHALDLPIVDCRPD
jgi:hypothetical protein